MKGITFGEYHSYRDLHLILTEKTIGTPSPKTELIDIPGSDGVLDFTEFFGETKYENRELSFEFSTLVPQSEFMTLFSMVQNALHGQKMMISLDVDPEWYYIGRITVAPWKADKRIGKLTIDCDCEPFKYKRLPTSVSVTLDGTSQNMYDISKITIVSTAIKQLDDDFMEVDYTNNFGDWGYVTFFHQTFADGEVAPDQNVTFILETKDFTVSGQTISRFHYTSHTPDSPDYFAPSNFNTTLTTHERQTQALYPAAIKDATTIANADYFIRSFISIPNGGKVKGKFRMSILPSDVKADGFTYVSHDGTMRGIQLVNGKKRAVPTITASSAFTLYHEGNTYSVSAGTTTIPELELKEGINDIAVKGSGTITFTWQEGTL